MPQRRCSARPKYFSADICIQVSPIEVILHIILNILNIFAENYRFLTKEEWNKVAISKLKKKSTLHIS